MCPLSVLVSKCREFLQKVSLLPNGYLSSSQTKTLIFETHNLYNSSLYASNII